MPREHKPFQPKNPNKPTFPPIRQNIPKGTLLVLEIGGNPMGDAKLAERMLRSAKRAGAWAVKFQAYKAGKFIHRAHPAHKELQGEAMPFGLLRDMLALARDLGLKAGLTVFGPEGLVLARGARADFIKLSSGDIDNLRLIRAASNTGIPLVLSTGASTQAEVDRALSALTMPPLALLQCSSLYPCPRELVNLAVMRRWLQEGLPAGLSDHSLGIGASLAAIGMGARMVEKHFTVDTSLPGGDNAMSIVEEEARRLASRIGSGDPSVDPGPYLGSPEKKPQPGEDKGAIRRFAVAGQRIAKGGRLSLGKLCFQRVWAKEGPQGLLPISGDPAAYVALEDIPKGAVILKSRIMAVRLTSRDLTSR